MHARAFDERVQGPDEPSFISLECDAAISPVGPDSVFQAPFTTGGTACNSPHNTETCR